MRRTIAAALEIMAFLSGLARKGIEDAPLKGGGLRRGGVLVVL